MPKKLLTETILLHEVEYWYDDEDLVMNESEIEYVEHMIKEGYNQGQLNQWVEEKGDEVNGWWNIK